MADRNVRAACMKRFLLLALASTFLIGCAPKLKFKAITPVSVTGHGGTTETVDGITFYKRGAPARKYKILGYLDDYRLGEDLDQRDLREMAPLVKQAGGTAAVV